ncbi:hypothetical protein EFR00_28470 [Rhizobium sophoriradicis]|nr:hypothetical protein EFR00_28470 [Rhizobium sophoriradicis]
MVERRGRSSSWFLGRSQFPSCSYKVRSVDMVKMRTVLCGKHLICLSEQGRSSNAED